MENYIKITIDISDKYDFEVDVLCYFLFGDGFTVSEIAEDKLCLYAKKTDVNEKSLNEHVKNEKYTLEEVESVDWNYEWEKNYFKPVLISGENSSCVIRSSFHTEYASATYEILINPKMSFGTGHHETTSSMINWLLTDSMQNKSVLDMGCGTAVLGILAKMRGAKDVVGVDIDEWCKENATENIKMNDVDMEILLGDASILPNVESYDVILANINRNILLADMDKYVSCLNDGGNLYMSGFYTEDIPVIREKAESLGLKYVDFKEKNNWVAVKFLK